MVVLGGTALGGIGTVVITTGLGCSGGFRAGRALPEGRWKERMSEDYRPLARDPRCQEALSPEEPSGDVPMLMWTVPSGGLGTSCRRHA